MSAVLEAYQALEERIRPALRPTLTEAEFGALALEVHAFQRRWNEPYANFCATRPVPTSWREIPSVPQGVFKRFALSCVPAEQIGTTFLTSGTTGESRGAHHFYNTRLYDATLLAGWRALELPRLRQIILAPTPAAAPHSSLSHMLAALASESDADQIWCLDGEGKFDLEPLRAVTEPVALLGTALAFLNLFEALEKPLRLPAGSFAMETGGYKGTGREILKAELYASFEQHLGLPAQAVINEYGMTELSSQFYTRGLGTPHTGGPWVRAVVINPATGHEVEPGQTGVLRLFDLANLNSVVALETQDLAIRREEGFELIGRDPAALPRGCSRAADELLRP